MTDFNAWLLQAQKAGFTHAAVLDAATIDLKPEVRQMCANNACGQYGKRWSCPPGCGELEELREKVALYHGGILVQSVGELEDEFDGETMMETERLHKERFFALQEIVRRQYPDALAIGVGCCTHCEICAYPDAPCRFPAKQAASMEAYGMVVSEVCKANHLRYYYGPRTISFTSCFLLE